jgi:hypothetical protein
MGENPNKTTMSTLVTNKTQAEKTIELVYLKMEKIYDENYSVREKNGEFDSPTQIDYLISKEYYVMYLNSGKEIQYSLNQLFGIIFSISSVGSGSRFESYYDEYFTAGLNEDNELLSQTDYLKVVNLLLELGNKVTNPEQLKSLIMDYYLSGMIQTEIREEGPSEGDIECIIELLIEDEKLPDEFDSLLNQALTIFNIK